MRGLRPAVRAAYCTHIGHRHGVFIHKAWLAVRAARLVDTFGSEALAARHDCGILEHVSQHVHSCLIR